MNSSLNILKIKNAICTEQVRHTAFFPDRKSQIVALVLSNNDIVVWEPNIESTNQIIKWIPWNDDEQLKIQGITFQPIFPNSVFDTKIELLVICFNGSVYSIPIDKVLNGQSVYEKYCHVSLYPSCPLANFVPTSIVWWHSAHPQHKNIAIIGGNDGQLVFYSLTRSHYLAYMNTGSKSHIFSLLIFYDVVRDYSYLLVTDEYRKQWKLLLEKEEDDEKIVLVAFEQYEHLRKSEIRDTDLVLRTQKSRLQEIKQISVDTFTMLKQKLNESRKTNNEKSKSESSFPESSQLISCERDGEIFLSVQQYRNRKILTGHYIHDSVLEVYMENTDSLTLMHHKYKVSPLVTSLLLTQTFIFIADLVDNKPTIVVFSTRLTEFKKNEIVKYNPASFIQSFYFSEDEQIISLFQIEIKLPDDEKADVSNLLASSDMTHCRPPQSIMGSSLEDDWNEGCLVVTTKAVYIISLKNNPLKLAADYIKTDINLVKRLPLIFNVSLSKIIELITDKLIIEKKVDEALVLCNRFKCYSGKITLRLASLGYIEELLLYTENLLNQADIDLPLVERIHLSNFVVTCYAERCLRDPWNENISYQFLRFLKTNRSYDEEVNVHVLANYRLCKFVYFLVVTRGLFIDGTLAIGDMIGQLLSDKFQHFSFSDDDGFWELFSEISLVESFVLSPRSLHQHIYFLRKYYHDIPTDVKKKLYTFYDPTQQVLRSTMYSMFSYPVDEYLDFFDIKNDSWGHHANMYDWITNFFFLHVNLYKENIYDHSLNEYVSKSFGSSSSDLVDKLNEKYTVFTPDLSTGFAHAALVRQGSLITWGQCAYGCLGSGPTLSQNSSPAHVAWFVDHFNLVKHVSCGKNHTLAITENGVYSWGSSKFGQLGTGSKTQSVHPRLVENLSETIVIGISAGQYHSLAWDVHGRLWTWGWGVYGQLGHGDVDDQYFPKIVEELQHVLIVNACGGQAHSVVLTKNGEVYTFGCNTYGQLGTGTITKGTSPVKVFSIQESIVMVSTNYFHTLAVSKSNRLYTWGCSPQVLKLQSQSQKRARSVSNTGKIKELYDSKCNGTLQTMDSHVPENYSESVIADNTSTSGSVDNTKHLTPTVVDTSLVEGFIKKISCGLYHSALLTTNNQIYTWGRNMDGQLGNCKRHGDVLIPTVVNVYPINMMSCSQQMNVRNRSFWTVSCGRDYTLVVDQDNRLFGWGNNASGQLGSQPQEDFSIRKFLNDKVILNKSAKRIIKTSHSGVNVIEKPVEIVSLPKASYFSTHTSYNPIINTVFKIDLDLPGLRRENYFIKCRKNISTILNTNNQILHYYLECLFPYYNPDFLLLTCAENDNLQAMSKICFLHHRFYEAFYYGLKALLSHVRKNYIFNSFQEVRYEDSSKKRLIPKVTEKSEESLKRTIDFEFVEDVLCEAVLMFEKCYKMLLEIKPSELGSFLKQCISVWIIWEIPLLPLENLLCQHLDRIAYPLAVLLFCDRYKLKVPNLDSVTSFNTNIDKKFHLAHRTQDGLPSLMQKNKYTFLYNNEAIIKYYKLYPGKEHLNLECTDVKYILRPEEILKHLSVHFTLKLCSTVVEYMSHNPLDDFEEFIRLLHEVIFSPSVLKADDRNSHEILTAVLSTLQKNQSPRKKFIQISYEELMGKTMGSKFVVFSCTHYYVGKSDYEKEVNSVVGELHRLGLPGCSELVNRLFLSSSFTTCCPNCLFQFIENELNSKIKTLD